MSQVRVKDWTGKVIHKKKRGFATKREALQWERDFISRANANLGMTFKDFIGLYLEDMEKRLKPSTLANKRFMIDLKITPFFGRMPLDEIKPTDIRRWQNELTGYRDDKGEPYSQTYLRVINNQITAIFNYAVKYYGLKENPCHKAGSMGKKSADEMLFWTRDEFTAFIEALKDRPASYAAFMTLYYTGMREGELLALTPADIDFEKSAIAINKSYQRLGGKDVITSPKTPKSNRVVTMPEVLSVCLKGYIEKCYGLQPDDRLSRTRSIFSITRWSMAARSPGSNASAYTISGTATRACWWRWAALPCSLPSGSVMRRCRPRWIHTATCIRTSRPK